MAVHKHLLGLFLIFATTLLRAECELFNYTCISNNNNLHHECDLDAGVHKGNVILNLNLCQRVQDWTITLKMDGKFIPGSGDYKGEKVLDIAPIGQLKVKVKNTGMGRAYLYVEVLERSVTTNIVAMDVYDSKCNSIIDWFKSQSVATLVTCGIGVFFLLLVLVIGVVYFCYCRGKEGVCRRLFIIDGVNEFVESTVPYVRTDSNMAIN